ncbi:MAG: TauD/TfdA family dioxygenase [Novosphingobium sp.]|nr:TauD/TfdA family dioxygenase [Novosphingobium sp.]
MLTPPKPSATKAARASSSKWRTRAEGPATSMSPALAVCDKGAVISSIPYCYSSTFERCTLAINRTVRYRTFNKNWRERHMSEFGWRECALAPFGIELTGVDRAAPLPAELAERLKDRDALTVISMIQTHRTVGYNVPDFLPHMVRPAVITHPRTAEPVLYVSDMQTARIEGLAKVESDALLQDLFAHLYDPANVYRHHWRNGDLVIWDNVALSHSRCDLAGMHPRKMQRVCCARRSFFDLLPNFSLDDPRIAAWGKGEVLVLEDSQGDA